MRLFGTAELPASRSAGPAQAAQHQSKRLGARDVDQSKVKRHAEHDESGQDARLDIDRVARGQQMRSAEGKKVEHTAHEQANADDLEVIAPFQGRERKMPTDGEEY